MNDAKDILSLLKIPSDKIQNFCFESCDGYTVIYIELKDERGLCPYCKSKNVKIKDYYKVRINNSIIKHESLIVEVNVRRYVCKNCGKSFKQQFDFVQDGDRISIPVKGAILDDLKQKLTFTQIAADHNVSINRVTDIFDKFVPHQFALPFSEIICIDEFCFKHSKTNQGKYPAVLTNPFNGKIIDIIESRWKSYLFEYFNKVKITDLSRVKYFVSDMNETYRVVRNHFFKNAIHIADRFHVIKAFNEAITKIRTRIIKQETWEEAESRYLKKNWKIFLMDREKLAKKKYADRNGIIVDPTISLDRCLKKYPNLYYAYWTKEEFRNMTCKLMYYGKACEIIDFFTNKLINNEIEEMQTLGKMLKNWRYEIINGITQNPYSIKISNAIAESRNNSIQTLINISYGLPIFSRMRKRVLCINRNEKD